MTDYISREAEIRFFNNWVDDLDKQINDSVNHPHLRSAYKVCKTQLLDCIHAIKEMPSADVVEVVRCKDCKLMSHDEHGYWCINDYQASLDPEKDYCSRAVRRADNGN